MDVTVDTKMAYDGLYDP